MNSVSMASVQLIIVAALFGLLCGPVDGWGSRRRRTPCPAHTSALAGAINSWDNTFTFECPGGQAISVVKSVHCNTAEDRVWRFECKVVPNLSDGLIDQYWSQWVNEFDGAMNYGCPSGRVVTGFRSEHSNHHEDRRWKLRCSRTSGMTTNNHHETPYANSWDGNMNYYVPSGFYIRGMHSYHDNEKEDRRYSFDLCTVQL